MKIFTHSAPLKAYFSATALAGLLVTGCASVPVTTGFQPPRTGDEGVVIAETTLVSGVSVGNSITGQTDDCSGPGLGIKVDGTTGGDHFLFDKNGEPCEAAQTLFDGRTSANRRQADPSINLTFHDTLGPVPSTSSLPGLQPIPEIRLKSELLPASDIAPAAGPATAAAAGKPVPAKPVEVAALKPDPLVATLSSWEQQDVIYASRSDEATAAAERNINQISKDIQSGRDQENVAKLMATLRERERQVQEEQRRHQETLERAQSNRDVTVAARNQWQQKEQELQASLTATQARLAQFEELSRRLNAEKAEKEKAYQEQISTLSADLKAAEAQADVSRRELVLKAAAKIAEAEQLANAAQLQEQEIKLREAARLKAEAETMMDRALAMKAGGSVVSSAATHPAVPMALMQTPIVLQASNQTLPDILANILNLAAPQAGQWKADWQLSAPLRHILKEKWSLTAEASVQDVLAQLQQQVQAAHGATLVFTQFGQSRLLVVTDATPPATEAAAK